MEIYKETNTILIIDDEDDMVKMTIDEFTLLAERFKATMEK
jgi:hypothetical protein